MGMFLNSIAPYEAYKEMDGTRFVFVMDEWDAVFHKSFISEMDKKNCLAFYTRESGKDIKWKIQ